MKQDLEELRIKQLFRRLREADRLVAPTFEATIEAGKPKRIRISVLFTLRMAGALTVAAIILLAVFLPHGTGRLEKVDDPPQSQATIERIPLVESPSVAASSRQSAGPSLVLAPPSYRPTKSRTTKPRPGIDLFSTWQSPTVSLLNTPGSNLLRATPNLDDSVLRPDKLLQTKID
jgi:hypothetical protein